MQQREEAEQIAVFEWAAYQANTHPCLHYLYHTPNGGHRDKATAGRLKAAGVKRGVPDICLPVPLGGYSGLYIELKVGKNKPTPEQEEWLAALAGFGYFTCVCYGFEETIRAISSYLNKSSAKGVPV